MNSSRKQSRQPTGFTLIEMLIVITVIILLLTITVFAVNFARDSERAAGGASKLQSFIAGARDRAIFTRSPVGVRLFLDSEDDPNAGIGERRTVSAMYYIDPGQLWSQGAIQMRRWDVEPPDPSDPNDVLGNGRTDIPAAGNLNPFINADNVRDEPTLIWMVAGLRENQWWELKRRGILVDGVRIRIPAGPDGTWYTVDTRFIDITSPPPATQFLVLQIPYVDPGDTDVRNAEAFEFGGPETYELELPPSILPSEPGLLPDGVVVDLDASRLPAAWRPQPRAGLVDFSPFLDIVFSPRGNIIGTAASAGIIHFYVGDRIDATVLKSEFIASLPPDAELPATTPQEEFVARLSTLEGIVAGTNTTPPTPIVPADELDPATVPWASELAEPGDPYLVKDRRIVSLFTQTGSITVHPVNPTDMNADGFADDPFLFAETGAESN